MPIVGFMFLTGYRENNHLVHQEEHYHAPVAFQYRKLSEKVFIDIIISTIATNG
jgi:hypothetical protein